MNLHAGVCPSVSFNPCRYYRDPVFTAMQLVAEGSRRRGVIVHQRWNGMRTSNQEPSAEARRCSRKRGTKRKSIKTDHSLAVLDSEGQHTNRKRTHHCSLYRAPMAVRATAGWINIHGKPWDRLRGEECDHTRDDTHYYHGR